MKVLSLFSGIGAFEKALKNLGIDFDLVGFCEIDKYAAKSYCAIHGVPESMNLGDITKVDGNALPKDIDLVTYGFPCQDISIAGKQKGLINEDGTQTRSGLFFEAMRIIEATKPKIAIAENVKNLVGKKFNAQFQVVLASLEAAGYNNYWKVLNAKHYGIPQNRERVFIVSIRKDIDNGTFKFPEAVPLVKRLKDVLEPVVDEKYYLTQKQFSVLYDRLNKSSDELHLIGLLDMKASEQVRRVYGVDGICPTISTMQGCHRQPKIFEAVAIDEQNGYMRKDGCVGSLTTDGSTPKHNNRVLEDDGRARKLTPKECFRLMGFDDDSFHIVEAFNSNTQLYKQAGNSIVVVVLEAIFRQLLDSDGHLLV
jgi:DNA (cytosine-5)-methyltransferase 1